MSVFSDYEDLIGRFVEFLQMPNFLTFSYLSPPPGVLAGMPGFRQTEVMASSQNGKKAMLLGCISGRENPNFLGENMENFGGFLGRKPDGSRTP